LWVRVHVIKEDVDKSLKFFSSPGTGHNVEVKNSIKGNSRKYGISNTVSVSEDWMQKKLIQIPGSMYKIIMSSCSITDWCPCHHSSGSVSVCCRFIKKNKGLWGIEFPNLCLKIKSILLIALQARLSNLLSCVFLP
jgi:hypothetical protein